MHQSTMRLVGLAATLFAATTTAVPVECGAINEIWGEQAAVVSNFPECESYYDNTNLEQKADIPDNHPLLESLAVCRRNVGPGGFKCPGGAKRDVLAQIDPIIACRRGIEDPGFKCPSNGRRAEKLVVRETPADFGGPECKKNCGNWKDRGSDGTAHKRTPPVVIGNKPPIFDQVGARKRTPPVIIGNKPPIFDQVGARKRTPPVIIGNKPPIFDEADALEKRIKLPGGVGNKPPMFDDISVRAPCDPNCNDPRPACGCGGVGNKPPVYTGSVDERSEEKREKTGNWPPHRD
ncbi:hypothetical protein NLG97_g1861 [Lecanicillium saksenae]|uniref:Uncharacterized protein n=1 Tax=Lecanicillium saksenae TaxID=468837 RepID=A0ACC1R4F0_9HYPO|nr:hypothetical protein NLG97_g1861 [Lecanicillium saksenae]